MVVGYRPQLVRPRVAHALVDNVKCPDVTSHLEQVRVAIEQQYIEKIRSLEEQPALAHVTSSNAGAVHRVTGRERLARLNEALNGFGLTRSKGQRNFHRNMTMAVIHKLFKDDFAENLDFLREYFHTDVFKAEVLIVTPRRFGKCLGADTLVLMADGTTRRAADVRVGDMLVGDDGRARIVMNTCTGNAPMFRIDEAATTPSEDSSFTCNDDHLLVFEMRGSWIWLRRRQNALEVVRRSYVEGKVQTREHTTTFARDDEAGAMACLERLRAEYPTRPTTTLRASVVHEALNGGTRLPDHFATPRRRVDHFPRETENLLGASREVRLQALADLLNADGCYEIVQQHRELALDCVRLARSLGFAARIHTRTIDNVEYAHVTVSKVDDERFSTSITPLGNGAYYGFQCAAVVNDADAERVCAAIIDAHAAGGDAAVMRVAASLVLANVLLPSLADGASVIDATGTLRYPGRFLLASHTVVHNTYAVAMFVAACAYALEGSDQAIFSTGRRASKKLLDLVHRFLVKLPGMKIGTKNVETITINGSGGLDDVRKISSYPSKVCYCCHHPRLTTTMNIDDDDDEFSRLVIELTTMKECRGCREIYTEAAAVARHECRRHAGTIQAVSAAYGTEVGTYECCGVAPDRSHPAYRGRSAARGCIACDHSEEAGIPNHYSLSVTRAKIFFGNDVMSRRVQLSADGTMLTMLRHGDAEPTSSYRRDPIR